jgi:tetratricopeptide (TPR) repeat protein
MRFRIGMIYALSAGLVLGGCAAGAAGGGPLTSPTGRVYEPGTPPRQTRFSQAATLGIAQANYEQAMASAQEGIAADSANPIHYFLAGDAAVGLGDYELADSLWRVAERIYPAYEMEIEPSRENAWANAFNEGVEAYNSGNAQGAITAWSNADMIYRFRPEAAQNLAIVLSQEGEYEEAIATYERGLEAIDLQPATRVMDETELAERAATAAAMEGELATLYMYTDQFEEAEELLRAIVARNPDDVAAQANLATALVRLNRQDEATAIYTRLLTAQGLGVDDLLSIGIALWEAEDHARAAQAFGRVVDLLPEHRDALFNQANALYQTESWQEVVPVAERLVQVDPLNEQGYLILARAHTQLNQSNNALTILQRNQDLPVRVDGLQLQPGANSATLTGIVFGNVAPAGSQVRVRFTFFGDAGTLGTRDVTLTAPATGEQAEFRVEFDQQAKAYKYEVLP